MGYPKLVIDRRKLFQNAKNVLRIATEKNIRIMGVVKAVNGNEEIIDVLIKAGYTLLSSSRLPQLKTIKEKDARIETCALRIPMLSELREVVQWADISLNSSLEVLRALNQEATSQKKVHKVILMTDLGDLREGFFKEEDLLEAAKMVEEECNSLYLLGIGVNLGCYGSIIPTREKMEELCERAEKINQLIHRKLEVVSGGATTSFPLVAKGLMPEGITQLRIGDGLFVSDLDECFGYKMFESEQEAFVLKAEIIEVREKPSHPIGEIGVDAFGNKKVYIDKGNHIRALIAVGRQDLGDCHHLQPLDSHLEVIGGSSDHTILDITNCEKKYQVGDVVKFHIMYENLLMLCQSTYVEKEFVGEILC
ncbi:MULTISPECIES: alanine racemase [Terrabacteria group]|uniref:alanine racemase n=1 Tax=Bacillati TaxID=1783272 RepID=UPI001C6E23E5|nr:MULTISPECIES: alanine racemase [Terrabacteria group]MBW9212017.1 alanine racemase [Trueperella sp. zg.1013]